MRTPTPEVRQAREGCARTSPSSSTTSTFFSATATSDELPAIAMKALLSASSGVLVARSLCAQQCVCVCVCVCLVCVYCVCMCVCMGRIEDLRGRVTDGVGATVRQPPAHNEDDLSGRLRVARNVRGDH